MLTEKNNVQYDYVFFDIAICTQNRVQVKDDHQHLMFLCLLRVNERDEKKLDDKIITF